jgi:acetyltransferase
MSSYRLSSLFSPRAIAVAGASPKPHSVGGSIVRNLLAGGFAGPISIVHPQRQSIDGIPAFASISELPEAPDVIVLATPAGTIPDLVHEVGAKGIAAAIIITAGLGRGPGSLAESADKAARKFGIRLIGPNCLGILAPPARLNASFAAHMPKDGDLALISQSGAIATGMVEWASRRALGFSGIVSIGDQLDVDFADLLDFFAMDGRTRAILLYVEAILDARKFMSAARAAARAKPVVVVKSGRHELGARAAATHTGALAGADAVYDAAFRRAGLLRVYDLDELFDATETLGSVQPFQGDRLAILTNGGGVGVLAVDRLADLGGSLSGLSPKTHAKLDAALPPTWSKSNPVDIIGDADEERYSIALEALLEDAENDAILAMNVPTTLASPEKIATRVVEIVKAGRAKEAAVKPVFASWIGGDERISAIFNDAGIPHFDSESDAIRGFMHLVEYSRSQARLLAVPPSLPTDFAPDVAKARAIVENVVAEGRTWLDPLEAASLFEAYGIAVVPTRAARDADEAAQIAEQLLREHGSVAIKIWSRDIVHKSDLGGVRLGLSTTNAVRAAAAEMIERIRALKPDARVSGVIVQPMIHRPKARELILGIADDPTFGPVVLFGHGGTATEVIDDKALALPPLDLRLARDLMSHARVSRLLKAYRNVPAAREDEVALTLVKLAQLAADLPEVREIDLNPLIADENGVMALDARVSVGKVETGEKKHGHSRFAIRPYPKEWERAIEYDKGQRVLARPVRPEDEPIFRRFFPRVNEEDLRMRFFATVSGFSPAFIARLTQIDYARTMAFVAIDEAGELAGVVRLHSDANYTSGEYAILLRSDLKGRGLGWKMMELIIEYARREGLQEVEGEVLADNSAMLHMCGKLGFSVERHPGDGNLRHVRLKLR